MEAAREVVMTPALGRVELYCRATPPPPLVATCHNTRLVGGVTEGKQRGNKTKQNVKKTEEKVRVLLLLLCICHLIEWLRLKAWPAVDLAGNYLIREMLERDN